MSNKKLTLMLSKNKRGTLSSVIGEVTEALLQLTFGMKTGYGAIQDNPMCYIPVHQGLFANIDSSGTSEEVRKLLKNIRQYVESYVTPGVGVDVQYATTIDDVINMIITIDPLDSTYEDLPKFAYQLGYDDVTGVYNTKVAKI